MIGALPCNFMELNCTTEAGLSLATLSGRLDSSTSALVLSQLSAWIDRPKPLLILDTSALEYISSDGLRTLLAVAKKIRAAGGKMALVGMREHIREIYEISGFQTIIPSYADAAAARAALLG